MNGGQGLPLHRRILAELEAKILSGEWPPGHRLPPEPELASRYGCARMTMNKAISALAKAGLISRRRRAGSFVAQPVIQSAVLRIPDMQAEIIGRGAAYGYELLARRRRKGGVRGFAANAPLLALKCRHLANSRPFAFEERFINLGAVPEAAQADFTATPPGSWLLAQSPWTRAAHDIGAINAGKEVAERLAIRRGAACLVLQRRTWRQAAEITYVRQIFPGATYRLTADFTP